MFFLQKKQEKGSKKKKYMLGEFLFQKEGGKK